MPLNALLEEFYMVKTAFKKFKGLIEQFIKGKVAQEDNLEINHGTNFRLCR
jgi:hypothetical protein